MLGLSVAQPFSFVFERLFLSSQRPTLHGESAVQHGEHSDNTFIAQSLHTRHTLTAQVPHTSSTSAAHS